MFSDLCNYIILFTRFPCYTIYKTIITVQHCCYNNNKLKNNFIKKRFLFIRQVCNIFKIVLHREENILRYSISL